MGPLVGVSFISAVRTYAEVERTERHVGRRRRSVLAADRRLGADLQRLRTGGGLPAAVRRDPAGGRRPAERRAEARDAAAACRRSRASRAKALVLLAGWLVAMLPPLERDRCCGKATAARVYAPELITLAVGPPAQRRADDRAGGRDGVAHRASVDGRDPDARASRSAPGSSTSSPRCRAAGGSAPPATRRRRWSPSSSTAWCASTSSLIALVLIAAGLGARGDLDAARRAGAPARPRIGRARAGRGGW